VSLLQHSASGAAPCDNAPAVFGYRSGVALPPPASENPTVSAAIATMINGQYPPIADSRSAAASCGPRIRLTSFAMAAAMSNDRDGDDEEMTIRVTARGIRRPRGNTRPAPSPVHR
jgi:hypothetical protein